MYGFVGRDSFENAGASGDQKKLLQGLLPLGVSNKTLTGNRPDRSPRRRVVGRVHDRTEGA